MDDDLMNNSVGNGMSELEAREAHAIVGKEWLDWGFVRY